MNSFSLIRKILFTGALATASSALLLSSVTAFAWEKGEDPGQFLFQDEKLETRFSALRLKASVEEKGGHAPWSETYWPARSGGIAVRYVNGLQGEGAAFYNHHYTLADLKSMSRSEIRNLAPSEKFDILKGNYSYPLTTRVLSQYKTDDPDWWGICHGWTPAAANYPEPLPVTVTNPDGITLEFGSSDIKALMSYYYAWKVAQFDDQGNANWEFRTGPNGQPVYWQRDPSTINFIYRQLGERCMKGRHACKKTNMNPASFHLALANVVGKYQRSFVVNVDPSKQVWNQPVLRYDSHEVDTRKPRRRATPGTAKQVLVNTQLEYVVEVDPSFAARGTAVAIEKKNLAYWLDLDSSGRVIGGTWSKGILRRHERRTSFIGFAWRASRVPFQGDFAVLNTLYKTRATKTTAYAMGPNYTPGLADTVYNAKNSSGLSDVNFFDAR